MIHRHVPVRAVWIVVLVAGWEATRALLNASPLVMPGVPSILASFADAWVHGELPAQLALSLGLVAVGMSIATVLALLMALGATHSPLLASLFDTLTSLFHPLPGIALLPVLILWFGTGVVSVLAIIVHSVVWPLLTNLRAGYVSMPPVYLLVGRNLGLQGMGLFFRVTIPASVPFILSGMRIAWARAWRALISAEMVFGAIAGSGGIGWFLYSRRVFMNTSGLFAGILVVMIVGVLVEDLLFGYLESRTVARWGSGK